MNLSQRKGLPITPSSLTRRATHGRPRAGSQRSDQIIVPSPAKTNEPPKLWPPLRQSRATKTPEPLEPDSDEVEVEMSLTSDQPIDDALPLPASEPAQKSNLRSFGTAAVRLIGWPVRIFFLGWGIAIILYLLLQAWQRASTPFIAPIPLRYTAWAVSSSAERLYPVAQPILHVSRMVKSEIQPNTIRYGYKSSQFVRLIGLSRFFWQFGHVYGDLEERFLPIRGSSVFANVYWDFDCLPKRVDTNIRPSGGRFGQHISRCESHHAGWSEVTRLIVIILNVSSHQLRS